MLPDCAGQSQVKLLTFFPFALAEVTLYSRLVLVLMHEYIHFDSHSHSHLESQFVFRIAFAACLPDVAVMQIGFDADQVVCAGVCVCDCNSCDTLSVLSLSLFLSLS